MVTGRREIPEVVVAAAVGWLVMVLPIWVDIERQRHSAAFLPIMADVAEGMRVMSLAGLFFLGIALGWLGKGKDWVLGFSCVISLPLWSIVDVSIGGGHNLLPFEWLIYGFYGVIAYLGVVFARRTLVRKTPDASSSGAA